MTSYCPKSIAQPVAPDTLLLAREVLNDRVSLVAGAGVSTSPPTSLPNAEVLARKVKQSLSLGPFASVVAPLSDDLVAVADAVEQANPKGIQVIQGAILDAFEFKTASPNYAHLAIALLLAEGKVGAVTTNWDTCIERASLRGFADVVACKSDAEVHGAGASARLVKAHGCAEVEQTILVSSSQIGAPGWWCVHQVAAAIATNDVVFLGVGSIPPYAKTTIKTLFEQAGKRDSLKVVAPTLSVEWDSYLQGVPGVHVSQTAEEFLDELLRALTIAQLTKLNTLGAELMADHPISGVDLQSAVADTITMLKSHAAHLVWLWVRRGAFLLADRQNQPGRDRSKPAT